MESIDTIRKVISGAAQARQDAIKSLQEQRKYHQDQIDEIDNILVGLGQIKTKKSNQGRGPRGNNTVTIIDGVDQLLRKYSCGLSRNEIVSLMRSEINYETSSTDEDFNNTVYCAGINKLVRDKKAVAVGKRLRSGRIETIYKHISYVEETEFTYERGKNEEL
jgi:hypothetical protein